MKKFWITRFWITQAAALLVSGVIISLAPSPASATSYPGSWGAIFGNSTSCSFVRASINDVSHKAGGVVKNVKGCSSPSNAALAVPSNYMGLRVRMYSDGGYLCSQSPVRYNTSTTSSLTVTTAWSFSATCNTGVRYYGHAEGQRKQASTGRFFTRGAVSPARYFAWSRSAPEPSYGKTKAGLTVGEVDGDLPESKRPELAARTGVNGKDGFIKVADVFSEAMPGSPEEAAAQEKAAGITTDRDGNMFAPVYAGDGETVIDHLLIGTVSEE